MDPVSISEITEILFKCQKKLQAIVEKRLEVSVMYKIISQVTKEATNIRNSMDTFQYVKVQENIMTDLTKSLSNARALLYNERKKLLEKQKLLEAKDKKSKLPRPESPLSPMVYANVYHPLTKKNQSKDHSKKGP